MLGDNEKGILREILYPLYHIKDVYTDRLVQDILDGFSARNPKDYIVVEVLQHVLAVPDFDFEDILPNLPHKRNEILYYLKLFQKIN